MFSLFLRYYLVWVVLKRRDIEWHLGVNPNELSLLETRELELRPAKLRQIHPKWIRFNTARILTAISYRSEMFEHFDMFWINLWWIFLAPKCWNKSFIAGNDKKTYHQERHIWLSHTDHITEANFPESSLVVRKYALVAKKLNSIK